MKKERLFLSSVIFFGIFVLALGVPLGAQAGIVGQIDDFESATTENWTSGAEISVQTGGPSGPGDHYLQIARTDYPFHIAGKNIDQWAGDYTNVETIELDMAAIVIYNASDLGVRILILGDGGAFTSTLAQPITGGWHHYEFSLDAADLTRIYHTGPGQPDWEDPGTEVNDLALTLATASHLLIRNDPYATPTPVGQHPKHVIATLGIDNVEATGVIPEPAMLALLGPALGLIALRLRRKR